jgi:hypothetical protein
MSALDRDAELQKHATILFGDYQKMRERLAKGIPRIKRLGQKMGISIVFDSFPMPAVGGPVLKVNLI